MSFGSKMTGTLKLAVLSSATLLAACSAEVSGGDVPFTIPGPGAFSHKVTGPNIDGRWISKCVDHKWSTGYIVFDMTVKGQDVTRIEKEYSNASCTTLKKESTQVGAFRYEAELKNGIFEVEYKFSLGNGMSVLPRENVKLVANSLWISDRYIGELSPPDIELLRDGNPSTKPGPTPAPSPTPTPDTEKAHAPAIGQTITYSGKVYGGSQSEYYTNNGFDSYANSWIVFYDIRGSRSSMGYTHPTTLWSTAKHQAKLASCVADGGTLETVTVKAGTFKTCKTTTNGETVWWGNVPFFGKVKIAWTDGSYSSEVSAFTL
ncbi:MAG: hypothetical protein V4760_10380 [Bdellovibrionota bacterium]